MKVLICPHCEVPMFWTMLDVPGVVTSSFRNMPDGDDGFGTDIIGRRAALRKAKAAGVSVTGKRFFPSLCRPRVPFDHEAWCDDFDDVKRKSAAKGLGCNGHGSELKPIEMPEPPPIPIAEDIVNEEVAATLRDEGVKHLPVKEYRDLKEKTRKRLIGNT